MDSTSLFVYQPIYQQRRKPEDNDLIDIVKNLPYYYDKNNEKYVLLKKKENFAIEKITSKEFASYIQKVVKQMFPSFATRNQISSLIQYLDLFIEENGKLIKFYNRLAMHDSKIYIELHNKEKINVEIDEQDWRLVTKVEVYFTKHSHLAELPIPTRNGNLSSYLLALGVHDELDKILLTSWLICCLFVDKSRPHLWIIGEHGTGKTSLANGLRDLVDPCDNPLFLNKKVTDLAQIIDHNAIPIFDNISVINKEISDFFCSTYTGTNFIKKKIYTDDEDFTFNIKKPLIITSICTGKVAQDLMSRTFFFPRAKLKVTKPDFILKEELDRLRPGALGALLTAVSGTMRILPTISSTCQVRTADFEVIGLAAAEALGYGKDKFIQVLERNEKYKRALFAKMIPSIEALSGFMKNQQMWTGTLSELLAALLGVADDPKLLPKSANYLSRDLKQADQALSENGYIIQQLPNTSNGRPYMIINTNYKVPVESINYETGEVSTEVYNQALIYQPEIVKK